MHYVYLGLAIASEVVATSALKNAEGFSRLACGWQGLVLDFAGLELQLGLIAVLGVGVCGGRREDVVFVAHLDIGVHRGGIQRLPAFGWCGAVVGVSVDIAEVRRLQKIDRRWRVFLDGQYGIKERLRHRLPFHSEGLEWSLPCARWWGWQSLVLICNQFVAV